MDIFRQLKKDHDTVNELMAQLEQRADDIGQREHLFTTIKTELLAHAKAEEQTFYAELADEDSLEAKIREARVEHEHIESLLKELEQMAIDTNEWMAKFKVLKENVEFHVQEEEDEIFELARDVFDDDDADDVGRQMERLEDEYRAQV